MADIVFDDDGDLVALVIDITKEERHRASATATEIEVERGVDITDHVRPNRDPITLSVVISDTPLFFPEGIAGRARDAWAQLVDAKDRALLATLTTKIATYEDMILVEALTTITSADGTWIKAELTFMPIRQVSSELVADPVAARPRDRAQVNVGAQATEESDERQTSLARQGYDRVLSLFGGS